MNNWLPDDSSTPFFGTRRVYEMTLPNGYKLIGSPFVCDYRRRTWRDRFFTRPWQPTVKSTYSPTAYIADQNIIVSIRTFLQIEGGANE